MKRRRRRNRSPEEIRRIVEEYEKSGLTQVEYARRVDICRSVVGRWIRCHRKAKAAGSDTKLVPVQVVPPPEPPSSGLEVVLGNGRRIHVSPGFNEEALGRVVSVLERC